MTSGPAILAILALAQLRPSPDPNPVPIAGVVVDATDRPVAGAEVWLAEAVPPAEGRRAGSELLGPVPSGPLAGESPAMAHARTDADGRFAVAVPAEVVARPSPPPMVIWAATLGQGPRLAWYGLPGVVLADDPPVRITLGPTRRSLVRVVDADLKPVAGARISPTRADGNLVPGPLGQALAATSDADGGATIAGLSPGWLGEVRVSTMESGVQILEMPDILFNDRIYIRMAPVGRIQGRLVAPHDEPIRGVTIRDTSQVGGHAGSGRVGVARVACDEQGRFSIPAIAAGMMTLEPEYDPEQGTTLRNWPLSRILVRAGRTTESMIPMHPTVKVRGHVLEKGTGRPIAGAAVMWNGLFHGHPIAVTDASGTFRGFVAREETFAVPSLLRVPEPYFMPVDRAEARQDLLPRGVDEATLQPTELPRGVEVRGTVVDGRGEPVAGAEVEAIRPGALPWVRSTRADAAGRFVLHGADPRAELVFRARDGLVSSAAVSYTPGDLATRPIVVIYQSGDGPMRTEALADRDGRFALPGVFEGPAIVLARGDGFRAHFQPVDDAASIRIELARTEEAPIAACKTLPPALPADEEESLARRLVQSEAGRVLAEGDDQEKYAFLSDLAAFDPADALERLEAARFADPDYLDMIRIAAAESLARENLDDGLAVVEALKTAGQRAQGYLAVLKGLPDLEPARARQVLDQAIVNARSPSNERLKIYLLEQIAGRLLDLGEIERAKPLIREGEELVRKTLRDRALANRLASFAGLMLRVAPAAAMPAFEELRRQVDGGQVTVRAFGLDRHYEGAAYHFAARDPAEAERLLRRLSFTLVRPANTCVVAVCARMAPAHLPRARKLADLITEDERVLKAYAFGLMAGAIARDRPSALKLLDDAYAELESLVDRGWTSQFASISGVAGRLLPVVEQVDASRLPEYMARALALRPPSGGRNDHAYIPERPASLAIGVARYDRGLAARLLRPELDALDAAPSPTTVATFATANQEATTRALAALALIDPRQAVERTERLTDGEGARSSRQDRRLRIARLLATRAPNAGGASTSES